MVTSVYFSIGSNMGNALENCACIMERFSKEIKKVRLIEKSEYYISSPQDYTDQQWFINAVGKLETLLDPFELLDYFKMLEAESGRDFSVPRFGPRVIDIDIIFFDDIIINTPKLTIPHQRMHQRRFVLKPLSALNPYFVHPVLGKTVSMLLSEIDPTDQDVIALSEYNGYEKYSANLRTEVLIEEK
ncbi:2-amino-4-hydroxy-6-hydroxymethyldihydropteridine diphosphokinase [Desulforegula conservatrix]|uniref:2-amino-4-hydroxy-6- hydroxymethyldihydropteridine diphosphokinase n=1 Tax=Desulforegula conservatrix TaxID=153026 RepID=UPI000424DFC4|nr:2-amino-4-hydroxy-6-hydroxymethyldihydropteridine diphosphokinase [Desulforegula conservatrix]